MAAMSFIMRENITLNAKMHSHTNQADGERRYSVICLLKGSAHKSKSTRENPDKNTSPPREIHIGKCSSVATVAGTTQKSIPSILHIVALVLGLILLHLALGNQRAQAVVLCTELLLLIFGQARAHEYSVEHIYLSCEYF